MKTEQILIRGARVADPVSGTDAVRDILIEGEKILQVGEGLAGGRDAVVLAGEGLTVSPGLMDAHVHFRDPGYTHKEDLYTGAAAAKRGGFTRVVTMANTYPVVDCPQVLRDIRSRGEGTGIRLMQTSGITKGLKGKELVDMEEMAKEGAAGFTDDGIALMDEGLLLEAMERAYLLEKPIALHEEDPLFVRAAGVNRGEVSRLLGYGGAFSTAEQIMVARDCVLALHTGASVCIQHISSAESVEIVRTAKRLGARVHAEATPHHFTLTQEAVLRYGTLAKMNPPLRTERDRQAIIEGLADGTIDLIATDHAPHSAEEKARPLPSAPSGIIGLETSLGLGLKELVEPGHLTLLQLIEKMSVNPARLYRVRQGGVAPGEAADLVIFGEKEEYLVDHFVSRSANSPFLGWRLPGKVHYTICRGQIVYQG